MIPIPQRTTSQSAWARPSGVHGAPHPGVRSFLAASYIGFDQTANPHRNLVLPASASVQLIFKLADSALRPSQFVGGAHGAYSVVDGACAPSYVTLSLAPLGGYALLGIPADELTGQIVDLADIVGQDGRRLSERLRDAPAWARRFELLDEYLLRRAERGRRPSPEVAQAWEALVSSGGTAVIGLVARDVGWSHKHLIAKFRQQVGLRPKTVARLIRLIRLDRARLRASAGVGRLDQIAAECGYADQAHLTREFQALVGMTPTEYLANRSRADSIAPPLPEVPEVPEVNSFQDAEGGVSLG